MGKMMNLKEISERFKGEWLLVEYEELDEELAVKRGRVIFHSPHKSEVYKHLLKIQGKNIAIEYAGKAPEELTVLFGTKLCRWTSWNGFFMPG